jgi:putative ABC transport system permease protein
MTHERTAPLLKLTYPEVEAVTRIDDQRLVLAHGDVRAKERLYWADTNFFDLFPFPVVAGDLASALARPDGIVLTRAMSRKYFGRDDAVGETLVIEPMTPMIVRAVIEDLPAGGTQFQSGIFASGLAEPAPDYFRYTALDPGDEGNFGIGVLTYFRIAPGASIAPLSATMEAFYDRLLPRGFSATLRQSMNASIELIRVDRVQLYPGLNPGAYARLIMAGIIGLLVLFIACVNFVNLSTARAERRAMEVGIRKISGAARAALIVQFIGEAMVSVGLAALLGISLTTIALPYVNVFLDTGARFDLAGDPALILWLLLGALALGTIAGAYPALVLAGFRPIASLKGPARRSRGAIAVRQGLVALQFAMLIGLMIATAVVYQQREYATSEALRVNTDQMLVINLRAGDGPLLGRCDRAFKTDIDALPGVRQSVCAASNFLNGQGLGRVLLGDGSTLPIKMASIQFGIFDLYGVKALAGDISAPSGVYDESVRQPRLYVVNETAARRLGFPTPAAAIGQTISFPLDTGNAPVTIAGVVPDFSLGYVAEEVDPVLYSHVVRPQNLDHIHIKLAGTEIPETLALRVSPSSQASPCCLAPSA